jgi:hypothetical protein
VTTAIEAELDELAQLATTLNRLPPPSRRDPEAWHIGRDLVARSIARSVGRLRRELGIRVAPPERAPEHQTLRRGVSGIVAGGRKIPVVQRRRFTIVAAVR